MMEAEKVAKRWVGTTRPQDFVAISRPESFKSYTWRRYVVSVSVGGGQDTLTRTETEPIFYSQSEEDLFKSKSEHFKCTSFGVGRNLWSWDEPERIHVTSKTEVEWVCSTDPLSAPGVCRWPPRPFRSPVMYSSVAAQHNYTGSAETQSNQQDQQQTQDAEGEKQDNGRATQRHRPHRHPRRHQSFTTRLFKYIKQQFNPEKGEGQCRRLSPVSCLLSLWYLLLQLTSSESVDARIIKSLRKL